MSSKNNYDIKLIKKNLNFLRNMKGLSIINLSIECDISHSFICNLLYYDMLPNTIIMKKIANTLGVSLEKFVSEDLTNSTEFYLDQKRIAKNILHLCMERNWIASDLSIHSKVADSTISNIINCKHVPSLLVLIKISKALEITLDTLIFQDLSDNDYSINPERISKNITYLCEVKGWSILKLSTISNCDPNVLYKIEGLKTLPKMRTLKKISNAFGIKLSYFIPKDLSTIDENEYKLVS